MKKIRFYKKGATFESYSWFLLFFALGFFTVALISLYLKLSTPGLVLGARVQSIEQEFASDQLASLEFDSFVDQVALQAALEVANAGGYDDSSNQLDTYFGAPIISTNGQFSFFNSTSTYLSSFFSLLTEKLESTDFSFTYSSYGISWYDETLYGFSREHEVKSTAIVPAGKLHYRTSGDFIYQFQNYSLTDYTDLFLFLEKLEPFISAETCVDPSLINKNILFENEELTDYKERFEIGFNRQCQQFYRDSFREYSGTNNFLNTLPQQTANDCRLFICVKDTSRTLFGIKRGYSGSSPYLVNHPIYNIVFAYSNG